MADKNRSFMLNDFLPKVESMPTQQNIETATIEVKPATNHLNSTQLKFGVQGKKVTSSVEAIAARIA